MGEPKITHTTLQRERRKIRAIVQSFAKKVIERVEKIREVDLRVFDPNEATLLDYRKRLVAQVKEGMLERKDMEIEIATIAALVWFMRLTKDERDRVTDLW